MLSVDGSGGATITAGTADPTGGTAGDAYVQATAAGVVQSIWRNDAGTWTEYTIPAGSGTLSDDDPENVGGAAAAGTGTEAARDDHVHALNFETNTPTTLALTGSPGTSEHAARADHAHSGPIVSNHVPEDVADTAAPGDNTTSARSDHVHALPLQNTLEFSGSGHLGVSISDIVEHLQQNIRYYTSNNDYSTDGSAAGQVYTTSRYPKNISHVKVELRPPTSIDDAIYKVGVYRVEDNNDIAEILGQSEDSPEIDGHGVYNFDLRAEGEDTELGIPLAGGERVAILCRRIGAGDSADTGLRHGSEAANSPNVSYVDAEIDFALDNHVVYQHENPAVGQDTHSHGDFIRGNIRIYYTVTIDHGSLIGDGNVDPAHIDSGTATEDQALLADGSGGAAFDDIPRDFRGSYHGWDFLPHRPVHHSQRASLDGPGSDQRRCRFSPSLVSPHAWALISRADHFLGNLVATNSYDLVANNWFRVGHRVFLATATIAGATGSTLTGGHANIVELTAHHLTQAQAENDVWQHVRPRVR